jgi:glutathione S-transferase
MKIIFGYWDLRGLGQSIRFMLKYLNIDYQEIRYKLGDSMEDPNYREDWLKDKFRLGLDFPNIPYYIEGDIKLTHVCIF